MLRLAQCKADLLMREGRHNSACEGTNIKTPAEGLQTQDVAVRVKPVHSCAYSSAQDVPVCSKLGRSSAQSRSTHQIRQRLTSLIQARFSQGFAKT